MKNPHFVFGFLLSLMFFTLSLFVVSTVHAAGQSIPYRVPNLPTLQDTGGGATATQQARFLIGDIITVFLSIAGIIAVWAIVNNAFWLVVSVGKGEVIDQRKKALFWAVSALILIILSYAIIRFITEFVVNVAEEKPVTEQGGRAPTGPRP